MEPEDLPRILKTLEQLCNNEFERFKWYLTYHGILNSVLEGASRHKTVTVMVNKFKFDEALEMTKTVLKKIPRNDLLQTLSDTSSGPRSQ